MRKVKTKKVIKADSGLPWVDPASAALAGVGGFIGEQVRAKGSSTRFDAQDKKANYISRSSSMVGTGAALGTAIAPGIGTIIGAGAGLVGGMLMAGAENRAGVEAQRVSDKITTNNQGMTDSNVASSAAKRDSIYAKSYGIPGFDKGIGKFYSNKKSGEYNANLSSEETVLGPDGSIDVVPGKYNQSNPDTVKASLEDGSGVLPKNSKFKLPYGKSTPADIGKRMASVKRKNDETMKKLRVSKIDKSTAAINEKNLDIAKGKLSAFVEAVKGPKSKPGNYDTGKPWYDKLKVMTEIDALSTPDYRPMIAAGVGAINARGIKEATSLSPKTPSMHKTGAEPQYTKSLDSDSDWSVDKRGLYKGAALSIAGTNAMNQYFNATPEVISPVMNTYNPTRYTSSLSSRLEDIRMRDNISKYNSRISGRNTGASNAINAAMQFNTNRASAQAFDASSRELSRSMDINDQLYANAYNANQSEIRRINDINARSRTAARGIKHDAINNIAGMIMPRMYASNAYTQDELKKYMGRRYNPLI